MYVARLNTGVLKQRVEFRLDTLVPIRRLAGAFPDEIARRDHE